MSSMFQEASAFNQNIGGWDISNVENIVYIFDRSGLSISNYNNILNSWSALTVQSGLFFSGVGLLYSPSGFTGHNVLSGTYGWTFIDAFISANTIYKDTSFTLTVNAQNGDVFYEDGDFTLTSTDLDPETSTVNFDGTIPGEIVFPNLMFTQIGAKIVNVLGLDGDFDFNYNLNVYEAPPDVICFKEGTKILTNDGYKLVQDLKKGDLVKTIKHGFKAIDMIGSKEIVHQAIEERIKNQLYRCSQKNYPELVEDLIITGCHSILVDKFDKGEREKTIEIVGRIFVTDNKYRLLACIDKRASVYENVGKHKVYQICLENDNEYLNYGIYANGLLVETSFRCHLQRM